MNLFAENVDRLLVSVQVPPHQEQKTASGHDTHSASLPLLLRCIRLGDHLRRQGPCQSKCCDTEDEHVIQHHAQCIFQLQLSDKCVIGESKFHKWYWIRH